MQVILVINIAKSEKKMATQENGENVIEMEEILEALGMKHSGVLLTLIRECIYVHNSKSTYGFAQ